MYLPQLRVEPNMCDEHTIHLTAINRKHLSLLPLVSALDNRSLQSAAHMSRQNLSHEAHHPFLSHSRLHLHMATRTLRWKVSLRASVLRSRTLLAKKTNMTIFMSLRVQDGPLAQDQQELQCPSTISTLQALIKVKEQPAATTRRAILHPLLEYIIRT